MRKLNESSSIEEVAATVSHALTAAGITAVLSGGAVVQIYSHGLYVSRDLDFVSSASHREIEAALGLQTIQILTPTQCVMDRLAAFYHWRDRQALDQAVAVAAAHDIDLKGVQRWSAAEGQEALHVEFRAALERRPT